MTLECSLETTSNPGAWFSVVLLFELIEGRNIIVCRFHIVV